MSRNTKTRAATAGSLIDDVQALRSRIVIIYNPTAGWRRRRRLDRVIAEIERTGGEVVLRETTARGDAERFAGEVKSSEVDVFAVAGGDGTLNEVVNGLDADAPPVAIIPLGTANVFAAEVGMPSKAAEIARVLMSGAVRPIYVGTLNGRRFVQMAGAGYDAYVVDQVSPTLKRKLGKMAYVLKMMVGLFRYPFRLYQVHVDGKTYEAGSAVIANGHFYGGTFTCAPEARLEAPDLKVCLFKSRGPLSVLRYTYGLATGRLSHFPDVEVVSGTEIVIDGGEGEPVQADGDVVTALPVTARVGPDTIEIVGASA